jgi:hypothetical protein
MREVSAETLTLRAIQHPASSIQHRQTAIFELDHADSRAGAQRTCHLRRNVTPSQKHEGFVSGQLPVI